MKVLKRGDIEEKYKWKTQDIYSDDGAFEAAFSEASKKTGSIEKYKNRLKDSSVLLECLRADEEISKELNKLVLYAHMKKDEDTRAAKYGAMYDRVGALAVKLSAEASFITPELSALDENYLRALADSAEFSDYDYMLSELIRNKKHILSEKEEELLAKMRIFSSKFREVFNMFDNADIRFDKIKTKDGEKIELTHGLYGLLLQNPDRGLRKKAYGSMFGAFKRYINTIAANYSGNVLKNVFTAKIRGYDGALDRALSGENVKRTVYGNLLNAVEKNVEALQAYAALRKKALKVKKLCFYDMHVPLVADEDIKLGYEAAYELVKQALSVLGEEYSGLLDRAFNDGWIDVLESANKRSGAYSTDAYGAHPYVLLNYQRTTHDVFTIAHELGHAMHSYYSNENQPYQKAGYEIFVAEVASTVNEVLLLEYLLKKAEGKERRYLLSYYLDMFRTTLFRQSMFAEFERKAHEMGENDVPINAESLSALYASLNKKYYGEDVYHDELISYEWARIPHFYNAFYVYKYATGITSAVSIAERILRDPETAVPEYKRFLSAGGSASPVDILRLAGVDLEKEEPFERAMGVFRRVLGELEREF